MKVLTQKKDHVPCSFAYKFVCIDNKFTKPIVVFREENADYEFIKAILKEYQYCKIVAKNLFYKNLIMSEEEEKQLQSSSTCWTCKKLIDDDNEKVMDHCHITGNFIGAAHWSCNINLQLTKNVPVIFHKLRGYDIHLIFCELNKFDATIDVIPNRLEKYMALFLSKNLVFITSIHIINSSLEKLVKNLSDDDFKNLTKEFGSKNLEVLKQKGAYPYEYIYSFKRFSEEKLSDKKWFYSSVKDRTTGDNGEKLGGRLNDEDYLMCKKIWNKFNMKNMGDYDDHY